MTTITPRAASSTWISAEKLQSIPCPNLRALVNEGWLKPDDAGLVDLKNLDAALNRLGVEPLPRKVLVTGAEKATHEAVAEQLGAQAAGKFNVFRLTGSSLDHAGDTRPSTTAKAATATSSRSSAPTRSSSSTSARPVVDTISSKTGTLVPRAACFCAASRGVASQ
jgi:hypothetical protein